MHRLHLNKKQVDEKVSNYVFPHPCSHPFSHPKSSFLNSLPSIVHYLYVFLERANGSDTDLLLLADLAENIVQQKSDDWGDAIVNITGLALWNNCLQDTVTCKAQHMLLISSRKGCGKLLHNKFQIEGSKVAGNLDKAVARSIAHGLHAIPQHGDDLGEELRKMIVESGLWKLEKKLDNGQGNRRVYEHIITFLACQMQI